MKKAEHVKARNLTLFTQDDLHEFEQLRFNAYSTYERGNPQFANENYDSWVKSKVEAIRAYNTISKRLLWAAVGYDHSVANNCIKDFIGSGELRYVLNAIEVLWAKAFQCPVITNIIFTLNNKYSISLWIGDKATAKMIEGFFKDIGRRLLIDSPAIIKLNKDKVILHKLQTSLSDRFNKQFTLEDTLKHIRKKYRTSKTKLSKDPAFDSKDNRKEMIQENKRLLEETRKRLQRSTDKKQVRELNNEIKDIENNISELETYEKNIHEEARKQTLDYLEKHTGIRIGQRYFDNILSLIHKLTPE